VAIAGRAHGEGQLEQQLLELNPMLEAFGNAKTVRNDNSSRFGKFIRLEFDNQGSVAGASMESYLLEKSRVIGQSPGERNFHIFYQLLAGISPAERTALHLRGPEQYEYLNKSGCYTIDRVSDSEEFAHTRAAMATCGINDREQSAIYRVLAAILHLGNVQFVAGAGDGAEIAGAKDSLEHAAELLAVSPSKLSDAIIKPRIQAGNQLIPTHLNVQKATDSRDALVKSLYGRVFLWIVRRINQVLGCRNPTSFIGVLDISGFEIFEHNSFEQLCINYTNEKLQQCMY
jgi:myosin heavy subunit